MFPGPRIRPVRLSFLAQHVVDDILDGRQPPDRARPRARAKVVSVSGSESTSPVTGGDAARSFQ